MKHIAVIDIGKTNAKLALVEAASLREVAVLTRPNEVIAGPPYPHFDVEGHWDFLLDGLARMQAEHGVDAISVTTHGACAVLLDGAGRLACPVLDYEFDGPDGLAMAYDALRPEFARTGSPRLPLGLNLGAQLHWLLETQQGLRDRVQAVLTYPQYWGFLLTGQRACDVSSLGCHTDLWEPSEGRFSDLVQRLGLNGKMAEPRDSREVLGTVLPEIAARCGLTADTPVHVGIHDSNASLLTHVLTRDAPFSVVSTGTWVICMGVGGEAGTLDASRDCLVNVSGLGQPVPSARFMGGREYSLLLGEKPAPWSAVAEAQVLAEGLMLLPSVVRDSGPFQGRKSRWTAGEPAPWSPERTVAAGFYLALMTATCLRLIGHRGEIVVEGPFARNKGFCRMLATAMDCAVIPAGGMTGTAEGAALLAGAKVQPAQAERVLPEEALRGYAADWRAAV